MPLNLQDERSVPPRRFASALVTTLTGNVYLGLATVLFSALALLLGWVPPKGRLVFRIARLWSRGVLFFSGVRLETSHEAPLDPGSSYVLMANHQSLFDIPALLVATPVETRFMAKRSLFQIPLFGWALRAGGFVSIDRRDGGSARTAFADALHELRSGASVLVFPEGTRSDDGRLLPFKRGGLLLALRSGLPVVPIGVSGTLDVQARSSYLIRSGTAVVRFGAAIDPGEFSVRQIARFEEVLRERISELAGVD